MYRRAVPVSYRTPSPPCPPGRLGVAGPGDSVCECPGRTSSGAIPREGSYVQPGLFKKYEVHSSGDPALPHLAGQSGMCRQYHFACRSVVTHLRNRPRGPRSHNCCHYEGPSRSTGDCTRNSAFQARVTRTLRKLSGTVRASTGPRMRHVAHMSRWR